MQLLEGVRTTQDRGKGLVAGDVGTATGVDAILHVLLGITVTVCLVFRLGGLLALDSLGPVLVELAVLLLDLVLALLGLASTTGTTTQQKQKVSHDCPCGHVLVEYP